MASARIEHHTIATNSTQLHVAMTGEGPPVVLLHGWPHTWQVWSEVIPELAESHRVIAPDLRGLGDSTRAATGYDVSTLAADVLGLLDALDTSPAAVVGIDAGSPVAFMMAMRSPRRVARLVMMESLLGSLPGAEEFLTGGPPWWFGFHSVPGLAETVLVGHEADYVNWFLEQGTWGRGAPPTVRDAIAAAYTGTDSLRCGFAYYRSAPTNNRKITEALARSRLTVPTLAIGAATVGDALFRQLSPIADDLIGQVIPDCGHIIPLDRSRALLDLLSPFLVEPEPLHDGVDRGDAPTSVPSSSTR